MQYYGKIVPDGLDYVAHYGLTDFHTLCDTFSRLAFAGENPGNMFTAGKGRATQLRDDMKSRGQKEWQGGSLEQIKGWMTDGYSSPEFEAVTPHVPTREKRKVVWSDDGGVLDIGLALAGDDMPFQEIQRKQTKPGVNLIVNFCMMSNTSPKLLAEYGAWIASVIGGLELAGIDPAITFRMRLEDLCSRNVGKCDQYVTDILVKRENEPMDFQSYSVMFSPAAFRTLGFTALVMHADTMGEAAAMGLGHAVWGPTKPDGTPSEAPKDFGVRFDESNSALVIHENQMPSDFPAVRMTQELAATGLL